MEDVSRLSYSALRALIQEGGLSFEDCIHKDDLLARAMEAQDRLASAPPPRTTSSSSTAGQRADRVSGLTVLAGYPWRSHHRIQMIEEVEDVDDLEIKSAEAQHSRTRVCVHCLLGLVALSSLFVIQGPVLSYLKVIQRQSGDEAAGVAAFNTVGERYGEPGLFLAPQSAAPGAPPAQVQSPLPRYPPLHQFRVHHHKTRPPSPRPPPSSRLPQPPRPPQPPRAPPQPPLAPLPAGPLDFWEAHPKTNCWWNGNGAEEVDIPNGTPVVGVQTLVACLRSCIDVPGYACDAIIWIDYDTKCYRKKHIDLPKCTSYSQTDLYLRTDTYLPLPPAIPSPPRPPPTPPVLPPSQPPPPGQPPATPPPVQPMGSHDVCVGLWKDPRSRFHDLWGQEGWRVRGEGNPSCWGGDTNTGRRYFDDAWWGKACETRNWYTGTPGSLGDASRLGPSDKSAEPHFTTLAPALLGFDETIDEYCQTNGGGSWMGHSESCVHANVNILSLYGNKVPYNICRHARLCISARQPFPTMTNRPTCRDVPWIGGCVCRAVDERAVSERASLRLRRSPLGLPLLDLPCRNVEWQLCAAKGTLPGQAGEEWVADGNLRAGRNIRFAFAPGNLEPFGSFKPLGACEGYMPKGCGNQGYASSDSALCTQTYA